MKSVITSKCEPCQTNLISSDDGEASLRDQKEPFSKQYVLILFYFTLIGFGDMHR